MTAATLNYARQLRNLAESCAKAGDHVTIVLPPVAAMHLANTIERGALPSDYIDKAIVEVDAHRAAAEDERLAATKYVEEAQKYVEEAQELRRLARLHYRWSICAALAFAGLMAMSWGLG